ncbi:ubiquinol-cytochrome c reductase iron-sulfur subunit [Pseudoroseomonas oryzae]|jgi:ubiquinol-cytochrome c reductase iron-sulfur subunit|uniref:Ubiquinol-cytochrome c reductase iron-sulfur subunit n=1 Tax=Teichococcus oryzae TaxID=1608942 RepID=A0A5B2TJA6_9PROT|nr:ubiquinol-cytochrome c reductase iron-sulfur subunit [Pseudoroseomonas oryzae]KAA2214259.1 ubiquinol-cytochrome c reductase iron-sulfur subunit [Pseudoroseomonas oryzae]
MADTLAPTSSPDMGDPHGPEQGTKRDFLKLVTGSFAAVGVGAIAWPFIASMNPAKDVLALASTDVTLDHIAEGQAVTVMWRGKPVFVRHRTAQEIQEAKAVPLGELRDPAPDQERVQREPWLVVVGVCTHLGCVPLGQKTTDPRGDFGGWFCPCHGSHYDTAGRIRRGPAPTNLAVPEYEFRSDTQIRIG